MSIPEGLIPKWAADHFNGRPNDAAGDRTSDPIPDSGPAGSGSNPRAELSATPTAATDKGCSPPGDLPPSSIANPQASVLAPRRLSPHNIHNIRVAIYVPVDTPDEPQNKGMSELSLFSRHRGWTVLEFPERRARAGTRPVFSRMMYRVWRRKFDVVLVESLDCFAHSMADLAEKVSLLHREGIRFIAAGEGIDIDPETVAGRESFRTLTVYAKSESKMIARSVRAGIAKAQSYGVKCGRPRRHFALAEARKLREQGLSFSAISARIGVPASTIADGLRKPGGRR